MGSPEKPYLEQWSDNVFELSIEDLREMSKREPKHALEQAKILAGKLKQILSEIPIDSTESDINWAAERPSLERHLKEVEQFIFIKESENLNS